jgi:hypothetical protein
MIDVADFGLIPSAKSQRKAGETTGLWTLLGFGRKPGTEITLAVAQCACGSPPKVVRLGNITNGLSTNCGCVRRAGMTKHGAAARSSDTREGVYRVWRSMVDRCTNPAHAAYGRYGARGIAVCDRWLDVAGFVADMSDDYRPGLTIERRDNDKGYAPDNCYWATRLEQTRNRRTTRFATVGGSTKTIAEWAIAYGIPYRLLHKRLSAGWPIDVALTRQPNKGRSYDE